ncbi:MAG: single-stranded DNA-binding protein [Treponema sp.]|jgi:single-strand DNA-binding protein|nr:single-stranded DNA-binding protein [Treponema sp.]
MADFNHVILIGRLTRDAEFKYITNGQAICKFSVAVNRRKKQGDQWVDEANFFDVTLWGRQAESLNQYLQKGKQIAVEGELRQDRWEQDGQSRSKVEIVANNIQLLGGNAGSGASSGASNFGGSNAGSSYQGSSGSDQSMNRGSSQNSGFGGGSSGPADDGFSDDIPF